jgi:outer membrane protein assembly factor BamB
VTPRRRHAGPRPNRLWASRYAIGVGIVAMAVGLVALAVAPSPSAAPAAENLAAPTAPGWGAGPPTAVPNGSATDGSAIAGSAPSVVPAPSAAKGLAPKGSVQKTRFPGGLLISDRGNGRLLIVNDAGRIVWTFPGPTSLPPGQRFSADDAFVAPDGRTIVANDEQHQVVDRIDIATRRLTWQYGVYDRPGSASGRLHTPDDAYPLANGDVVVADIRNCRILEIAPSKRVVRHWGRAGACSDRPPAAFAMPNGDTPLADGGLLITEITGSRVIRLAPSGRVVFDVHVPVRYPSDAHLTSDGSILVVDYSAPGAIVRVSPAGRVLWQYKVRRGPGELDHPSLAIQLPDGTIALNDDFRHRVLVIDPRTDRIVWQYGTTGRPGRRHGYLDTPDGIDVVPAGTIPGMG